MCSMSPEEPDWRNSANGKERSGLLKSQSKRPRQTKIFTSPDQSKSAQMSSLLCLEGD